MVKFIWTLLLSLIAVLSLNCNNPADSNTTENGQSSFIGNWEGLRQIETVVTDYQTISDTATLENRYMAIGDNQIVLYSYYPHNSHQCFEQISFRYSLENDKIIFDLDQNEQYFTNDQVDISHFQGEIYFDDNDLILSIEITGIAEFGEFESINHTVLKGYDGAIPPSNWPEHVCYLYEDTEDFDSGDFDEFKEFIISFEDIDELRTYLMNHEDSEDLYQLIELLNEFDDLDTFIEFIEGYDDFNEIDDRDKEYDEVGELFTTVTNSMIEGNLELEDSQIDKIEAIVNDLSYELTQVTTQQGLVIFSSNYYREIIIIEQLATVHSEYLSSRNPELLALLIEFLEMYNQKVDSLN
ncbi:hypothetical protein QA601_15785 [Chitinispirillales bacterium ANBcel5]|uniref:hypothetical protein n=1 Tax=Cellulosispirillum alkaliphilum TaxID=3039283 RepID=UPI002A500C5C|nr:hypothetical protein [Chitinispirillales bacterium ANBcel5]